MSRIIQKNDLVKERTHLSRNILYAVRELTKQTVIDEHTMDILAFIYYSLIKVTQSIDLSVSAWEKRGYWIKADRFRMEWIWSQVLSEKLYIAIQKENWTKVAEITVEISKKLSNVKQIKNQIEPSWNGSWEKLKVEFNKNLIIN